MKVIIAAAGTGGHINPGIAIANKIIEEEPQSNIIFIGTNHGLENDLVPRAGYKLKRIEAYGINRKININNIKRLYKTIKSIGAAKKILKKFKPDFVIGTGGYICIPTCLAADKLGIPIVLHESNAFPGVAIKVLSKRANKVLVGFEDTEKRLPNAKKVILTGTPSKIRKLNLDDVEKESKILELGLKNNDLPIILVFGGSQGALSINKAIIEIIEKKLNKDYQIIWAVGISNYKNVEKQLLNENININNINNIKILPYIYNMQEVMNIADLVVCRSGAMTITEISIIGKPAIFIPFPFATENHQEYNAKVLEKVDAAKIILDKDLTGELLNETIKSIIIDKNKLYKMGENASKIVVKNVEDRIYNEIKNLPNTKK